MRFGLLQVGLGLLLFGSAYALGGAGWLLAWPAFSVLFVGLGYLGLGPRVFGKRAEDGTLSGWRVALVLPYFVVAWLLWQLRSRLGGEAPWHEVAPGVRLGRRPLGLTELPPDTRCVVDLTSEFPRIATAPGVRYRCLPTLDTAVATDLELAALVDAIADDEGPLFVHCAMGHGRSATVAAALLIRRGLSASVDDAVAQLVRARPSVHLHPVQRAAVARLASLATLKPLASARTHDPSACRAALRERSPADERRGVTSTPTPSAALRAGRTNADSSPERLGRRPPRASER